VSPTHSAVIVAVPEAEETVGAWRAQLDPSAGWGVPAHVTVLFPFLPPASIDAEVLACLAQAVRTVPSFDAGFARVEWFDDRVVWLAPEPALPFRELTAAACGSFPGLLPYGGAYGEPVPHLTVAQSDDAAGLRQAASAVAGQLPVRARVDAVQVICGSEAPGSWQLLAELPLGPPAG